MTLDTLNQPPADPTAPKPWWQSRTTLLGIALTVMGLATYFAEPSHDPTLTVASISEAVGGVMVVVLRVWFTNSAIQGTPAAAKADLAKQNIALHAAQTVMATPAPPVSAEPTLEDLKRAVEQMQARRVSEDAFLSAVAGLAQPKATSVEVQPAVTPAG